MLHTAVADLSDGPLRLAYSQLTASDEVCTAGERYPERTLGSWFLQVTVTGEAEARCDGVPLLHRPGSIMLLAPQVRLEETVHKRWHLRYLMCDGPWAEQLSPLLRGCRARLFADPPRAAHVALTGACDELQSRRPAWAWRLAHELAGLHAALLSTDQHKLDGDVGDRVASIIDTDPSRPWDVPALAKRLGMAARTLQAQIRRSHPEGVARLVLARRLSHARVLLERGMTAGKVSERLGFANPYHFSRACRRVLGVPPSRLLQALRT